MKRSYDDVDATGGDQDLLRVLKHQAEREDSSIGRANETIGALDASIAGSEALLHALHRSLPLRPEHESGRPSADPRSWPEVLAEARAAVARPVGLADLLESDEIRAVENRLSGLRFDFDAKHRLDASDWSIAGAAGALGALVDVFLVGLPRSPGFLGGTGTEGGPLSNFLRERLRTSCTPEEVRQLEQSFHVPYDAAHSGGLGTPVAGLGPRTHRFQSLGHDPLLGFIFGTADILRGSMTAIDSSGRLIRQVTEPAAVGMSVFEAVARQFGHLRSDVSTSAGLPAPLMPLLQLLQIGKLGKGEHTIGQLSRLMYAKGYDFGHFLAMSIVPAIVEVVVRVGYAAKRLNEGHALLEALPFKVPGLPTPPKLNTMLFTAHLIATAANAGKLCLGTGFNPLSVNYTQWIAFTKYALTHLQWVLVEKEAQRSQNVQDKIEGNWGALSNEIGGWWATANTTSAVSV